ncbi:MAG: sulfotransferase [Deltaproteobacteria bacterium]|nr:sulfotransferase [Deltaproteobacteria bacterium]
MMNYKKISSFDADERLPQFRKKKEQEDIVQLINEGLQSIQQMFEKNKTESNHQILLILGAPRSGTTLLSQMLASRLDVGYPSNLMARFYEAPAVGAFLQETLIKNRFHNYKKYQSIHGTTQRIEEPHEFGYFWSRHLAASEDVHEPDDNRIKEIDIRDLNTELQSVVSIFKKPVVFKCPLGNFFIPVLRLIPNIFFIDLQRNLLELAQSIWRVRQERLGSAEKWWSLRPRHYYQLKRLPPAQQIAGQILAIRSAITRGLSDVEENRKLVINYEELIKEPEAVIDKVIQKLLRLKSHVKKVGEPISYLGHYNKKHLGPEIESEIEKAFDQATEVIKI